MSARVGTAYVALPRLVNLQERVADLMRGLKPDDEGNLFVDARDVESFGGSALAEFVVQVDRIGVETLHVDAGQRGEIITRIEAEARRLGIKVVVLPWQRVVTPPAPPADRGPWEEAQPVVQPGAYSFWPEFRGAMIHTGYGEPITVTDEGVRSMSSADPTRTEVLMALALAQATVARLERWLGEDE